MPLAPLAVEAVREARALAGEGKHVFAPRGEPIAGHALAVAMRRLAADHDRVGLGMRIGVASEDIGYDHVEQTDDNDRRHVPAKTRRADPAGLVAADVRSAEKLDQAERMYSLIAFDSCCSSSRRDLTTSPIDTMPTSRPSSTTGK